MITLRWCRPSFDGLHTLYQYDPEQQVYWVIGDDPGPRYLPHGPGLRLPWDHYQYLLDEGTWALFNDDPWLMLPEGL